MPSWLHSPHVVSLGLHVVHAAICACIGAEPVPFIPREAVKQALLHGPKLSRDVFLNDETTRSSTPPSLELMTLPVCLQFARTLGARSLVGRRMISADKLRTQHTRAAAGTASRRTRSRSDSEATTSTMPTTAAAAAVANFRNNSLSELDEDSF